MSFLIRPARADDVPALALLAGPVITGGYLGAHSVFAGSEGSVVTGFYALEEDGGRWTMTHLCVAPEWRGRGRGRWLFSDAVRRIRQSGPATLRLAPDAFFARMGGVRVGAVLELDTAAWEEPMAESVSEM
ncbi:MAG TPA: GNAT family N-acetyltransferase [Longimicrobium sp.]|nr:GNAT family N-acetyltransferase [Longimicrobium sp.]